MTPFQIFLLVYGILGIFVTIGLLLHYSDRRNGWPDSLADLNLLECILYLTILPELILYGATKYKPFKARNKVR
jgi:hypothetical protein